MANVKGIGRRVSFGVAKEASRGVAEAAPSYWIPFQELGLDEKFTNVVDEQSYGVIEDSVGQSRVKEWSEGSFKAAIGDKHFPLLLYALLGSKSVSGPTDSAYTHSISVAQSSQHPSLTLFIDDPLGQQDYAHALGVVSQLEIAYEMGKFVIYTANVKAKKGATATLTPSIAAENLFLPQHLTFKLASSLSGLGAASATVIKSASIKISQNIEDDDVLGSAAPNDFLTKQITIEGSLEALFQNESDFKTAALANTAQAMRLDLQHTALIGASSKPQITIDLAKVIFKEIAVARTPNDLVKQTLSFKAHYSISDTKMIAITAINAVASY